VGTLAGDSVTGIPRIIDGDTIWIGSTKIRLHGIDAPETKQTCTANGKEWRCGEESLCRYRESIIFALLALYSFSEMRPRSKRLFSFFSLSSTVSSFGCDRLEGTIFDADTGFL